MTERIFQIECWFEGRVQGVGFRVQTLAVARGFELTGTVRNLTDGRVYLFAEGEKSEAEAFVEEVQSELEHYIRKTEMKTNEGPRSYKGFTITH